MLETSVQKRWSLKEIPEETQVKELASALNVRPISGQASCPAGHHGF